MDQVVAQATTAVLEASLMLEQEEEVLVSVILALLLGVR